MHWASEVFPVPGGPAKHSTAPAASGFRRRAARYSRMHALACPRPACPASRATRTRARPAGAVVRRFQGSCCSHPIQSLVFSVPDSDGSPRRRRSRAMASRTAGGSRSAAPSPSASRTTAGVMTSGARASGDRRASACRQTRASFTWSSFTPASFVWTRITSRTAARSKRTSPVDAAVRHASAAAGGGSAVKPSSSAGDATSSSITGTSGTTSVPAVAGSGARDGADADTSASNGRFSRCCSAMASFSCSV